LQPIWVSIQSQSTGAVSTQSIESSHFEFLSKYKKACATQSYKAKKKRTTRKNKSHHQRDKATTGYLAKTTRDLTATKEKKHSAGHESNSIVRERDACEAGGEGGGDEGGTHEV
jgi:hypothetical protein